MTVHGSNLQAPMLLLLLLVTPLGAELSAPAQAFVEAHCLDCHDSESKEAGLDLETLPFDLDNPTVFARWVYIHDRVRDGEMPPRGKKPEKTAVEEFLGALSEPMMAAHREQAETRGRTTLRRLNRYEYANTLRDLFDAPWLQLKDLLPEDGEAHRFNKVGHALDVSHIQMAAYLKVADAAIRDVLASSATRSRTVRHYAREQQSFVRHMYFDDQNREPERATTPLLGHEAQIDVLAEKVPVTVGATNPEVREREAFGVVNGNYVGIGYDFNNFQTDVGGRYRLRLKAYSYWAGPGTIADKWWEPDRTTASRGRRKEPITLYALSPPSELRRLGSFDVSSDPAVHELEVSLLAGESIRPDSARLFRSRPGFVRSPWATPEGMPGVAYSWLEVEGPIHTREPSRGRQLLFGDLPLTLSGGELEVEPRDARSDAERLLQNFLEHAYQRPPEEAERKTFLTVILGALDSGTGFADAMIAGYSAVLASPGFLYFEEKPGELNDRALASRLAYFLWNSPPDEELRALARDGQLHDPDQLRQQTHRLLSHPKSRRFVDAFLDYWLDLRKISATTPDSALYPDYYLDDLLLESAVGETQLFLAELLSQDLPARNLISADFSILNERLAEHYDLPPLDGVALRHVKLPPESQRGGLLTQASVLKITANGTTTSPVLRGVWVMERILGKPPPPPPANIPAIEPDTRGAVTIREQLEKHRTLKECSSCHTKIDPAGFALENFDILGAWRSRYRALGDHEPARGVGKNGLLFTFHYAQRVDLSSELPDGRAFKNLAEFKQLVLTDERQVARNLVQQLVVYATGAAVRFGDRPEVEQILDRASSSDYGVSSIIGEVVQSRLFRFK